MRKAFVGIALCLAVSAACFGQGQPFKKVQLFPVTTAIVKDLMVERIWNPGSPRDVFELAILDAKTAALHSITASKGGTNEVTNKFECELKWAENKDDAKAKSFVVDIWFNDVVTEAYCFDLPAKGAGKYVKTFYDPGLDAVWCTFGTYKVLE